MTPGPPCPICHGLMSHSGFRHSSRDGSVVFDPPQQIWICRQCRLYWRDDGVGMQQDEFQAPPRKVPPNVLHTDPKSGSP